MTFGSRRRIAPRFHWLPLRARAFGAGRTARSPEGLDGQPALGDSGGPSSTSHHPTLVACRVSLGRSLHVREDDCLRVPGLRCDDHRGGGTLIQVPMAIKAAMLLKQSMAVLARWESLRPEAKHKVQSQAVRVRTLTAELGRSLRDHQGAATTVAEWEEMREAVLTPKPEAILAKLLIGMLNARGEMSTSELAAELGATGKEDGIFKRGLAFAIADGFVERAGFFKYRVTEQADGVLTEGGHIIELERRMVVFLKEVGLADREEIAAQLGVDSPQAPEFRAALERGLVSGEIDWLDASTYGLPLEHLADFEAPAALHEDEDVQEHDAPPRAVKEVASDLSRAVGALSIAMMSTARGKDPGGKAPTSGAANEPYEELRKLGDLRDAGVITPEDFDEKKSVLLARIR